MLSCSPSPENMEQVVEDALQHGGPVQVPLPGHQDLRLVRVTCMRSVVTCHVSRVTVTLTRNTACWNVKSAAGIVVSLVQTKEVQRPLHSASIEGCVPSHLLCCPQPTWSPCPRCRTGGGPPWCCGPLPPRPGWCPRCPVSAGRAGRPPASP